jgi:hypothetical protein
MDWLAIAFIGFWMLSVVAAFCLGMKMGAAKQEIKDIRKL